MKTDDTKEQRASSLFALVFVFLAVGVVAAGYFYYKDYERKYIAEVEHQLSAVADLKEDQLVQWRKERLGDGNVFYKNIVFSGLAKRYFENRSDTDAKKRIKALMKQVQVVYSYNRICLHDAKGVERISIPEEKIHAPIVFFQRSAEVLKSGKVEFQDFYRDENDNKVYLTIFVPVLDEYDTSRALGVLAMRIDPEQSLYPLIRRWLTLSRTAETLISRREGNEILFLNELKYQKNTALRLRVSMDNKELPSVKAALGQQGIVEGMDYRGVPVIADVRKIPDSPWFQVARIDASEVYAPVRERLWTIVVIVALLLVGAGAGLGWVWRYQRNRFYREKYDAAEELRQSEEKYRELFENAQVGMYRSKLDGSAIVAVNRKLCELFGYSEEEMLNNPATIRWADPRARNQMVAELRQSASLHDYEMDILKKSGEIRSLSISVNLYPAQGYLEGSAIDITERKRAEEALRESQEKYRTTMMSVGDGVIATDTEERVELLNPVAETLTGWQQGEARGKSLEEIFRIINEETRQTVENPVRRVMREGIVVGLANHSVLIAKDGTEHPIADSGAPIRDQSGAVTGVVLVFRNQTEERAAQRTLRESEERFRVIFEQSTIGNSLTLPDGKLSKINRAFADMLGRTIDEMQRINFAAITHPDDIAESRECIRSLLANERSTYRMEKRYQHKNGTYVWTDVSTTLLRDSGGTPLHFITSIVDISERKRAEEVIKDNEKRFRELIESLPQLFWTCRVDGPCDYLSKQWVEYTGIPEVEQFGYRWLEQLHPDDRDRTVSEWMEKVKTGISFDVEFRIRRADGIYHWFKTIAVPMRDSNNNIVKWFGSNTDVDDLRRSLEAQGRLVSIIESATDMISYADINSNILYMNKAGRKIIGLNADDDIITFKIEDFIYDDAKNDMFNTTLPEIMKNGSWKGDSEFKDIHGKKIPIALSCTLIRNEIDEPEFMAVIARDITDKKLAEEALQESEERFRIAAETSNDVIYEWDLKQSVKWFGKIDEMLGYDPGEFPRTLDGLGASVYPEDWVSVMAAVQAHLEGRAPYAEEYRAIKKDGTFRWWSARGAVARTPDGKPIRWVGTVTDITERKQAGETLRETNEYLENLFNYANAPIIVWDTQFRITRFNRAFESLTGRFAKDVIGESLEILFPPALVNSSMELIKKTLSGERWEIVEISIQHIDGSVRTVLWNSATIFGIDGKTPVATIAQGQDITERERAEQANRRYAELLKLSYDAIIVWRFDGGIESWSLGAERLYGYTQGEVMARVAHEVLATVPPKPWLQIQAEMRKSGFWEGELRQRVKDGSEKIVSARLQFVRDPDGVERVLETNRDITERKRGEEALLASEARYRSYIDATGQIGWVTNADGEVVEDVPSLRKFSSQTYEEAKGLGWAKALHPDDLERSLQAWNKAVATKSFYEIEYRMRRHDGVYRYLLARGFPVFREDGSIREWVGTCIDITERKQAEESLSIQKRIGDIFLTVQDDEMFNEVLKIVLDLMQSPYGVFGYLDDAGALVVPSMTRHIWDKCQVAEKTFIFPKDTWGDSSWARAIRGKKSNYSNEISVKTPEGHITLTRHISLPILFQGEVIGLFQVANKETDYTDADINTLETIAGYVAPVLSARLQRQLREKEIRQLNAELEDRVVMRTALLEASNKELEAFTYSVSHDLRAPLRHISGFVELLTGQFHSALSDKGQHYLNSIADSAHQMGKLIDDLLHFSRTGRTEMHLSQLEMNGIVQEVVESVGKDNPDRAIEWVVRKLPSVYGDDATLRLVWMNLLSNAVKFTRTRKKALIEIGAKAETKEVIYFVRDNGVGFDMKYAQKLFGVFQRLHSTEEFEGTGIGLANVHRIVMRHGGRTWAEAEPDKGATFYFSIPHN